jgi:hypothetical protein
MRLRSMRAPLLLVSLAGCGSSGALPGRTQPTETVRVSSAGQTALGTSTLRDDHAATIAAPYDAVWAALPAVFDSLGIPVTVRDAASGQVGNTGFEVRRLLGGTMVSRYFDCGGDRATSSALSYDLFVAVTARLSRPSATETGLSTTTTVRGRPISTAGGWTPCESLGLLERRIVDAVARRTVP